MVTMPANAAPDLSGLIEQARGVSGSDGLEPRVRAQRLEDPTHVIPDRVLADPHLTCDVPGRAAVAEVPQDLVLAGGQLPEPGRTRTWRALDRLQEPEHADDAAAVTQADRAHLDRNRVTGGTENGHAVVRGGAAQDLPHERLPRQARVRRRDDLRVVPAALLSEQLDPGRVEPADPAVGIEQHRRNPQQLQRRRDLRLQGTELSRQAHRRIVRLWKAADKRPVCEHMFVHAGATILHADLDAFFASVEQRDDARLRGRPVIVGVGVVLAASYEAKAFGVRTAMGAAYARRLCPQAVIVPPRMPAYSDASKAVFRVFDDTTPLVEALSIDEAFLDVRGMERSSGTPAEIAVRLRRDVLERVGLPISVGVARTKFLAKVASAVSKPDGLLVVPPDRELEFLHPLPVERLWGVGPVTAGKLRARSITTVGQIAQLPEASLVAMLGRASGRHLHALAHNLDPRPVHARRRRRSIGSQRARRRAPWSLRDVDADLVALVDRVTRRMRAADRVGRTVVIRLRFADYTRATRSHTLLHATASTETILVTARALLAASIETIEQRGLTLIGLAVANLEDANAVQLVLHLDPRDQDALDAVLDEVRTRFGATSITRAVLVGRESGDAMPLLPD
jgi:DNA polymerase-4